jgi:diacylglycerol kinase (ATP)
MKTSNTLTFSGRLRSVEDAVRGILFTLATQHNAWIHATATAVVTAAGMAIGLSVSEWTWIVLAIGSVWTAETMNTAFELLADVASPTFHPVIGKAKDVAAGAVLLAAIGSMIVGALVFAPKVIALVREGGWAGR